MELRKEAERICRELGNKDLLWRALGNEAFVLAELGDLDGAMELRMEEERLCRELGNKDGLQNSLGYQASIFRRRGDLDRTTALYKGQERICREMGDKQGLQVSLGNQALILNMRGDIEGALALHKEQERLCRELGSQEALSIALACEANILRRIAERRVEAKQLVEEALQIATSHGYQHNIPLYEHIRDAIAAEENKSRILWDGYNPTPHPSTDGARAAQLNIEYQRALKNWQALPWLKRMRTRKPTPPTGI